MVQNAKQLITLFTYVDVPPAEIHDHILDAITVEDSIVTNPSARAKQVLFAYERRSPPSLDIPENYWSVVFEALIVGHEQRYDEMLNAISAELAQKTDLPSAQTLYPCALTGVLAAANWFNANRRKMPEEFDEWFARTLGVMLLNYHRGGSQKQSGPSEVIVGSFSKELAHFLDPGFSDPMWTRILALTNSLKNVGSVPKSCSAIYHEVTTRLMYKLSMAELISALSTGLQAKYEKLSLRNT